MNDNVRVFGQNLGVEGKAIFNSQYSDKFTITHGISLKGKLVRSQPIYPYNELGSLANIFSLLNTIRYASTLFLLFVFYNYLIKNRKMAHIRSRFKTK